MRKFGFEHNPDEWRIFFDASKTSLKGVLLHNGNIWPTIPVLHTAYLRESYLNLKLCLEKLNYAKHQWRICGDFKVIGLLLGQQSGFTKYPCFLCEWNSRDRKQHYKKKHWPTRNSFTVGEFNIKETALIDPERVLLPPLHIKLGLMKQFVRALNPNSQSFEYIKEKFPNLSLAKVKAGVFVGPQIRKLMYDEKFLLCLNQIEKDAWLSFKDVVENFLGNHHPENCEDFVEQMLINFEKLGCNMSVKVHFLHSHFDYFPKNLGDFSEEHGERFHQDIKSLENRYAGKWSINFLGDYCWKLVRERDFRINKKSSFFSLYKN